MASATEILIEPYGKAGPFGEVLWYLLSEVRTHFIRSWANRFHDLGSQQAKNALQAFREEGVTQSRQFLNKLTADRQIVEKQLHETWVWPERVERDEGVYTERIEQLCGFARRIRSHFEQVRPDRCDDVTQITEQIGFALEECLWPYLFLRYKSDDESDFNITWLANLHLLLLPAPRRIDDHSLLYPSLRELKGNDGSAIYKSVGHWTDFGSHILGSEAVTREKLDIGHVRAFRDDHVKAVLEGNWLREAPARSRLSDWFYWNQSGARFCLDQEGQHTEVKDHVVAVFYWCSALPNLLPALSDIINDRHEPPDGTALRRSRLIDVIKPTTESWKRANGPAIATSLSKRLADHYRYLNRLEESRKQLHFGVISHSIKNLFSKNRAPDRDSFERRIWLEQKIIDVLLGTSQKLDWSAGYSPDIYRKPRESVTQTLKLAWNQMGHNLDVACLEGRQVRSAFLPIAIEIVRNMNAHGSNGKSDHPDLPDGPIFHVKEISPGLFDCTVRSCATVGDADKIVVALCKFHKHVTKAGTSLTGLWTILYFLARVASARSEIEWIFRVPQEVSKNTEFVYCLNTQRKGRVAIVKQEPPLGHGMMEMRWTNLEITL